MRNVENLREAMKRNNINYYIIPSSDPHQSEYVSETGDPWENLRQSDADHR